MENTRVAVDIPSSSANAEQRIGGDKPGNMAICAVCRSTVSMLIYTEVAGGSFGCCDGKETTGGSACNDYIELIPQCASATLETAINAHRTLVAYVRRLCLSNMARLSDRSGREFVHHSLDRLALLKERVTKLLEYVNEKNQLNYEMIIRELGAAQTSTLPIHMSPEIFRSKVSESIYSRLARVLQADSGPLPNVVINRRHASDWVVDKSLRVLAEPVAPAFKEYSADELDYLRIVLEYYHTVLARQWPLIAICENFFSFEREIFSDIVMLDGVRDTLLAHLANDGKFNDELVEAGDTAEDEIAHKQRWVLRTKSHEKKKRARPIDLDVDEVVEPEPRVVEEIGDGAVVLGKATSSAPEFEPTTKMRRVVERNYDKIRMVTDSSIIDMLELSDAIFKPGDYTKLKKQKRAKPKMLSPEQRFRATLISSTPIAHSHIDILTGYEEGLRVCWIIIEAKNTAYVNGPNGRPAQIAQPVDLTTGIAAQVNKTYALFMLINIRVDKNKMVTGKSSESKLVAPTEGSFLTLLGRQDDSTWHILNMEPNDSKHMFTDDSKRRNVHVNIGFLPHSFYSDKVRVNNGKQTIVNELKYSNEKLASLGNAGSHTLLIPTEYCVRDVLVKRNRSLTRSSSMRPTLVGFVKENNFIIHPSSPPLEILICNVFKRDPSIQGKSVFTCRAKIPDVIRHVYYMTVGEGKHKVTTRMLTAIHPGATGVGQ